MEKYMKNICITYSDFPFLSHSKCNASIYFLCLIYLSFFEDTFQNQISKHTVFFKFFGTILFLLIFELSGYFSLRQPEIRLILK